MELFIDNRQDILDITEDTIEAVKEVIKECLLFEGMDLEYEVSLSFVDNKEIRELNKVYRNKDNETDVLSFPMEDEGMFHEQLPLLGDIVISTEKIISQAEEYNHSFKRELLYLITHSMFHLMGYDHIEAEEKEIMRNKEKEVMRKIKVFKNN